jgi:hypothetical protein
MKLLIFIALFFCTVKASGQYLHGRWIWPDDGSRPKIIVQFFDTNYVRISVNNTYIIAKNLLYKIERKKPKFILKVKKNSRKYHQYDSCFIVPVYSNIIMMYGGFMDKPINDAINELGENNIPDKFINVKHKHKRIYLYRKKQVDY